MGVFGVVDEILWRRAGVVSPERLEPGATPAGADLARAAALELAAVGVVPSTRLEQRLATIAAGDLAAFTRQACAATLKARGGGVRHTPLFRRFPDDVPADTGALWWQKVLSHYLQAEGAPCLFCGATSTTHVLSPCAHVVCDRCFDGSTYSACPVCEHHVDRASPFFRDAPTRGAPIERVRLRRVDIGAGLDVDVAALLRSLCSRTQALSPTDRDDLTALVKAVGARVLPWLPTTIPVKENIALVFGTLFSLLPADAVLAAARPHLGSATDVLRLIAVMSGADAALQGETRHQFFDVKVPSIAARFPGLFSRLVAAATPAQATAMATSTTHRVTVPTVVKRFKVAKLSRPVRRALLALLEGMGEARLVEDMRRHRSYWVWIGQFLHPHEYADRFPAVARAFHVVRKQAPDGTPAPPTSTFNQAAERLVSERDVARLTRLLATRPGELARRFDAVLRRCGTDDERRLLLETLRAHVDALPTPLLLTLRTTLATRTRPLPVRLFFPKGQVGKCVSAPDGRPPLAADVVAPAVAALDDALLRRFAGRPAFARAVVDDQLADIIVPFNERTASRAAVALPRGSHLPLPDGKTLRLFLHWCQPETGGDTTDIDLSVGFYDDGWNHVGLCSYSQLQHVVAGRSIARSSGDLRDAPFPDGASEFVDVDVDAARDAGHRYAVMVVTNYAGMPFSLLERGFAGLMLRDDVGGAHFDPRTVALRFSLSGENGVFLPLVVDLQARTLHWLDVYATGQFLFNNVQTSNRAIRRIGPEMLASFGSGVRPTMLDLALLHAAARCRRVERRGRDGGIVAFVRRDDETVVSFLRRLREGTPDEAGAHDDDGPVLAALLHGDLAVPAGSLVWALFPETLTSTVAASDLLV